MSRQKVISLLLEGYSITEVAEMLQVSRTTIYNRRKEFLDYAEKEGIHLAAKHFEVEEDFEALFNLARELKNNSLQVDEAKKGSEIAALINSIETNDPARFIEEIIEQAKESDITGDEITKYALMLRELEEIEGKSYSQLIVELEDIDEKKIKAEKNLEALKEQVENVSIELDETLKENEVTKSLLESHTSIRENLAQIGLDFSDLENLKNVLENIKEQEYDLDQILEFFGSARLSRNDLERYMQENSRLVEQNKMLLQENYNQEEKLAENLGMVSAMKHLKENQITPEDILEIASTASGLAEANDYTMEQALEKFITDVKTQYNERSGYVFQLEDLKRLSKTYQEKNLFLKEELDILEEVLDERRETVDSLKKLATLGVDDTELIEWGKLVKDLEYDLSTFREAIASLGGISEYWERKTAQISLLEAKEKELEKTIQKLEERMWAVQSTLDMTREVVESNVIKINQTVREFEEYFTSSESGLKVRNIRIVNEMASNLEELLTRTKTDWSKDMEQLNLNVEKTVEETERILENAYKGGRIVGRFHALEPIHKILREEDVSSIEGTIGVITMLTYIQIWMAKNYSEEETKILDKIISRMMEGLKNIY